MLRHNLVIKHNGKVITMGQSVPIRKRRFISIGSVEKNTDEIIAYFTKEGEKIFDEFMENKT
jgi:hypothetical protein